MITTTTGVKKQNVRKVTLGSKTGSTPGKQAKGEPLATKVAKELVKKYGR